MPRKCERQLTPSPSLSWGRIVGWLTDSPGKGNARAVCSSVLPAMSEIAVNTQQKS